jgi:23S rRNA U2552 (ribose-2'-O)-methylase RlmE/FtsJ
MSTAARMVVAPVDDARYARVVEALFRRRPEVIVPGLVRIRALAAALGDPQHAYDVVHITGTNGKTSTARMVTALLVAAGREVGTYTSPHLQDVRERIRVNGAPVDLVLSDMAPNISGMAAVDIPRAMYLAELALDFADSALKPGGDLLVKAFQGEGYEDLVRAMKDRFTSVTVRKPKASRARSREVYLLARNRRA